MIFFRKSLYFRLLKVYGLTFFLLLLILGGSLKCSQMDETGGMYKKNFNQYAHYLAVEIGHPPKLDVAKKLSKDLALDIAILGPDTQWSTSVDLLDRVNQKSHSIWTWGNEKYLNVKHGEYTFYFSRKYLVSGNIWWCFSIGLLGMLGILYISYRLTRKIFSPLEEMKESIWAFGEGKWNVRVKESYVDEFHDLSTTLNTMAGKIERHFINMRDLLLAISHELRSPLTRMKLALEFVSDEKIKNSLNEEINALDRMTEMLLERERLSARPELLDRMPTGLSEFIKNITKGMDVGLDLNSKAFVDIDQTRFSLAIKNIVDNAFKHGKAPVTLRTYDQVQGPVLEINDKGPGMDQESLGHLGEPFYRNNSARTSSRQTEGYGLGLSLSYSILKAHGLKIEVESNPTNGTTFFITF